jgi:ABC-2 type transport system permease protein/lipopolysaccharide transport system permease protein
LHNIWIFVITAVIFGLTPNWAILAVIPGVALLLINGIWIGLLLGLVSARFRDVPQVVASIVQVGFFVTPIIWKPDMLPDRAVILHLNPLYHLLEVTRGPMLGSIPSLGNYAAVLIITVLGWAITILFYTVYRWRISYWV